MQRCGSSHGNTVSPCPFDGRFHTQQNPFKMWFSGPFDHESSVDCTLSLGNPSTRGEKRAANSQTCVPNFCWDLLQVKQAAFQPQSRRSQSCYQVVAGSCINGVSDCGDPMLARRCSNCDTTSTPLWRNGPRGPKSLCNACGIRFKKEERRATSIFTTTGGERGALATIEPQHPWLTKVQCFSPTIRNSEDSSTDVPFLAWRLNMMDRPSLIHNSS